jgi:DNA-binding CsgD family transcriptional regulator
MEVLRGLARGLSTAQLVDELGISPETVRNHVRGIFRVLGVHSRLEAVLRAQQLDLV